MSKISGRSIEYTINTAFKENSNRKEFFIVATGGPLTIELGSGGGLIPLEQNGHFNPRVAPTAQIDIVTATSFVVYSDVHETV